jgi:hypothetical protein
MYFIIFVTSGREEKKKQKENNLKYKKIKKNACN